MPVIRIVCAKINQLEKRGEPVSEELKTARDELKLALVDRERVYDYQICLKIGDIWLHLESLVAGIKDFGIYRIKARKVSTCVQRWG